ncbi:MAG: chloramphenicol acetyltransferase [Methylobacterium sp.]|nr:chloramphenicol acetyltransferase [Methylobacterium sp.]
MPLPDPLTRHPVPGWKGTAFLKAIVDHPLIEVGDYSYYDDSRGPEHFVARCVRYHFEDVGDRLVIGRFVAIAQGAQFVMNGANHPTGGFSTYPFALFDVEGAPPRAQWPGRGDMVIGHDVWIGREAVIMPGVTIGDGAIIGTRAQVVKDVPPYAVVAGNPGRVMRMRFPADIITELLTIRWWDWGAGKIARNIAAIAGADIDALRRAV